MNRAILATGLVLAISPASAQTYPHLDLSPLPGVVGSITVPPPQFDHPAARQTVRVWPADAVLAMCRLITGHADYACSQYHLATRTCDSYFTDDFADWQKPLAIRHEAGVCNEFAAGYTRQTVEKDFVEP